MRIVFALLALPVLALASPSLLDARGHLQRSHVMLLGPDTVAPSRHEASLPEHLALAAASLETASEDKKSAFAAAKRAVANAQEELAQGNDEAHRARALRYVIKAENELNKPDGPRGRRR